MPPLTMLSPLSVVAVSVPVAAVSPVSSTFTVVVPLPMMVSGPLMFLSVPPVAGALLPIFSVFVPRLASMLVVLLVPVMLSVSAPEPSLRLRALTFA